MSAAEAVAAHFAALGRVGERAPKYFIQTFGCQQNEADSERLAGLCAVMGYAPTANADEADIILVNTCAVREHAEKKALSIIGNYKHIKEKINPALIIGVGGCMVTQKSRSDKLKGSYPYVSFTFDTGALHSVPALVKNTLDGGRRSFIHSEEWKLNEGIPISRRSSHMAWLSIMYGCNNFCSYCIVPYVRGRERSRSADAVIEEAKKLIAAGAKDITLLGQNVNSYSGGGVDIAELMHRICALDGDFRLRFMTSHPKDASPRLIEAMATEDKIVKHFHLPIQSGSDRILKLMNRKYTAAEYLEKIALLKERVPDVAITSDIIVGFPGETDEDFAATLDILERVRYDMVFSFIYSPRAGTPAASMADQIPHDVSSERMTRLLAADNRISGERNERFVDRTLRVLVEDVSKTNDGTLTGRASPVRPIHFVGDRSLIGQFVNVKITKNETYCLVGEIQE